MKCKTITFSTLRGNIKQHIDFSHLTFYFSRNYQHLITQNTIVFVCLH
jgi:hypothetical protein